MAKNKKEKVVEKTTEKNTKEEPKVIDKTSEDTIKVKMKPILEEESIAKVDLSKPPKIEKDAVQESKTNEVDANKPTEDSKKVVEEIQEPSSNETESVKDEPKTEESPVIEEISEEEKSQDISDKVEEVIEIAKETGTELPEGIQKVVDFMNETGGDLNDYVKLNQDYSEMDNQTLLYEYYKQTKPHLQADEIDFLMEDQFSYDEEVDDEKEIKRKKLALKEQVASAKSHLEESKSKYYEDIKAGSKLTKEQQKAIDFFNRYNKESEENKKIAEKQKTTFLNKTDQVFNDKFKGFEYNVGDKRFRVNVREADKVKETQSDINNFIKKFLNKNNAMEDAAGYHKSLYTAMNADAIAKHFYEQGKTDALQDSIAKAKNVDMTPRQSHGEIETSGLKFKVLGEDSNDFKFKIKNRK